MWLARILLSAAQKIKGFWIELYKFCDKAQEGLKYLSYEYVCV